MTLRDRVIKRLKTTGWCQGEFGGPEGPNCILGAAFQEASGDKEAFTRFANELASLLFQQEFYTDWFSEGTIEDWNDTPGRTLEEVLELLELLRGNHG